MILAEWISIEQEIEKLKARITELELAKAEAKERENSKWLSRSEILERVKELNIIGQWLRNETDMKKNATSWGKTYYDLQSWYKHEELELLPHMRRFAYPTLADRYDLGIDESKGEKKNVQ